MRKTVLSWTAALALFADPASADPGARLVSSLASGSERLALYSASKYLEATGDPAVLPLLDGLSRRQAFPLGGEAPRGVLFRTLTLAPVLRYDGNINGGNVNDSFTLSPGLVFESDPEFRAREGIVLGATVAPRLRYALGRGRSLEGTLGLYGVYSPEHDLMKASFAGRLCSAIHLGGWSFADFCLSAYGQNVELGQSREVSVSAGLTRLFRSRIADHAFGLTARGTRFDDYRQPSLELSLESSFGAAGTLFAAVGLAPPVMGELAERNSLALRYARQVFGRYAEFALSRSRFEGGRFLDTARRDTVWRAALGLEVLDGALAEISYSDQRSSVDFFSYNSFGFGISLRGIGLR